MPRDPSNLDAYILGSGLASLTAAVHLLREAHVPPSRIHIIETLSAAGETTRSYGDSQKGYDFRAGIRPQFNDACMDNLLSLVPSMNDPSRTVRDEVLEFARGLDVSPVRDKGRAKFLTSKRVGNGVGRVHANKMGLGLRDRMEMVLLATKSEKVLGRARICDCFSQGFFRTGYWVGLATTFGLKPSHSAAEFRRYLKRFHNLHDLNYPHLLDMGRYNVHESIIAPIAHFLQSSGVDFRFNTTIADILFANDNPNDPSDPTRVTKIVTCPADSDSASSGARSSSIPKEETTISLNADDIVIVNLGSIFSSIVTGSNNHAPPSFDTSSLSPNFDTADDPNASQITAELDENWLLWLELCTKHVKFGNAYNFCTRLQSSRLESFTITLENDDGFFERLASILGEDELGRSDRPNRLLMFKDTPWLMTVNVPTQPLFPSQPRHIKVCYGYALHPEKNGTYITKPMLQCSGREILTEILKHLHIPQEEMDPILESAITIPCIQPRAAATLLPRNPTDRPGVIPKGMTNMAVIGPFVEIAKEVVVTADYSVRGAQRAVRELVGVEVYRGLSSVGGGVGSGTASGGEVKRRRSKRDSAVSFLGLK